MSNPSQLFLLADHIKLSLLERKRTESLSIDPAHKTADLSVSLGTLQNGLTALEANPAPQSDVHRSQIYDLRQQYNSLLAQYHGESSSRNEFDKHSLGSAFPVDLEPLTKAAGANQNSKNVHFTDRHDEPESAKRYALMPYKDDPEDNSENMDHNNWDNQQIHTYHKTVLRDQDEQLDRLGTSIGRQRELSIQIGSELDDQVDVLDDIDERVTRHQGQLDRAKTRLGKFAKRARDNLSLTVIGILVLILILLLIILK